MRENSFAFGACATLAAAILTLSTHDAMATITVPDSGSGNCSGACRQVTNSNSTGAAYQGISTGSIGYGVYGAGYVAVVGSGTSRGVWGAASLSGATGVHGSTTWTTGNGVVGEASGASANAIYANHTGNGTALLASSGTGWAGYFSGKIQVTGTPYCSGCTAFTNNSDSRLKKNIEPLSGALDRLLRLRGVTFEWKDPSEHGNHTGLQRGFIAQEVEKVLPEWVGVDDKGFKTLNLTGIEPMVVESLRTLKQENDALRDRVRALENNRGVAVSYGGLSGPAGLGLGLAVLAGAVVFSRRNRAGAEKAKLLPT